MSRIGRLLCRRLARIGLVVGIFFGIILPSNLDTTVQPDRSLAGPWTARGSHS